MSLISRITTWTVNQILTSSNLNGEFNNIINLLNNIDAGTTNFTNCNSTSSTITTATVTTLANTLQKYRRPVLQYNSSTVVNIETGINGTSGQLGIMFPDGTYRTDSTTGRIQCNLAQVAALTGTAQSGLRTGAVANNTWYAVYAVKSQVNTTDIVAVADTVIPTQANYATLNTNFGTNGWVFIDYVRNGDNSGSATGILSFYQVGNFTFFNNVVTGNSNNGRGIRLATSAGATSLTYTYVSGTGAAQIPSTITMAIYQASNGIEAGSLNIYDQGVSSRYARVAVSAASIYPITVPSSQGLALDTSVGGSVAKDIFICGYYDGVLGVGSNPIL